MCIIISLYTLQNKTIYRLMCHDNIFVCENLCYSRSPFVLYVSLFVFSLNVFCLSQNNKLDRTQVQRTYEVFSYIQFYNNTKHAK